MLQDIGKSLAEEDDNSAKNNEDNDDGNDLLKQLVQQGGVNRENPPDNVDASKYGVIMSKSSDPDAAAQGYVHIPTYMWNRVWVYYYYVYYRHRSLHMIHG